MAHVTHHNCFGKAMAGALWTILLPVLLAVVGCSKDQATQLQENETDVLNYESSDDMPAVKVVEATKKTFSLKIITNGKITSMLQSQLPFKTGGVVEEVYVANGDLVKPGQVLAKLENTVQKLDVEQANIQLAEAKMLLNEMVIQFGGEDLDTNSVSQRVLESLKIKSGLTKAVINAERALLMYDYTYIKAPYEGIVANLNTRPHNLILPNDMLCTLLSRRALIIEAPILESELHNILLGQQVKISPIALKDKMYKGKVSEINPIISDKGLAKIKVAIEDPDNQLFEGMNANIEINKTLQSYVTVPSESVVERSGKKVVFTVEDGLAKWKYVTIAYNNDSEVAIAEGLVEGDKVITEGNLNLGHDAPVKMIANTSLLK